MPGRLERASPPSHSRPGCAACRAPRSPCFGGYRFAKTVHRTVFARSLYHPAPRRFAPRRGAVVGRTFKSSRTKKKQPTGECPADLNVRCPARSRKVARGASRVSHLALSAWCATASPKTIHWIVFGSLTLPPCAVRRGAVVGRMFKTQRPNKNQPTGERPSADSGLSDTT